MLFLEVLTDFFDEGQHLLAMVDEIFLEVEVNSFKRDVNFPDVLFELSLCLECEFKNEILIFEVSFGAEDLSFLSFECAV